MAKFRKKPVVIEAFQMTGAHCLDNSEWPEWLSRAWQKPDGEVGSLFATDDSCLRVNEGEEYAALFIQTLEGVHRVTWDDWIIRGVKGELYACKPDVFEATYEKEPDGDG